MVSESGLLITSLSRFYELKVEDRPVMLVIVNDESAFIFSDGRRELKPVNLMENRNEGDSLEGLKICNSYCQVNSKYFAIG